MKRACLALLSVLGVGCADIRETAANITTITLGSDSLSAVKIEQSVKLADQPLIACIPIQLQLEQQNATVSLQPSAAGCALTLNQPGLVLLDKKQIEQARKQVGSFDIDGIRGGSVELMQIELLTGEGQALELEKYVDAVTVAVDGAVLLDKVSPDALQEPLKRKLPDALIDKLKNAVKRDQPASADIELTLWLNALVITDVPTSLSLSLELQPELEVSLLEAI